LSKSQLGLVAKLAWGVCYGFGFGLGIGYVFDRFQQATDVVSGLRAGTARTE